ncbi:MAG: type II secretion system F family protein [Clostridium sp.]|nr:type II secretion system F family protein [Acetatifactor muris]MCM1526034.1 type II secretion system F family protein [Bacteroides sp.]MCM1562206.1 type II secretion system F family protein [Clostridium sp.]
MATFSYTAVDKTGKEVKGNIEADNIEQARQEARRKEMTLLSIKEQGILNKDISIDIGGKPKPRDLGVMCRQFVSMARAGVTMIETLKMLSEQTENKKLKAALGEVRLSVEKGEGLAVSMREHPKIFPELMINMVAAGEASGNLDTALERASDQLERSAKTQSMVKKAMIYPIAVCVVALIVAVVMLVVVLPSYADMFEDLGTELPGITKAYIAMSNVLIDYWYIIVPVVIILIVAVKIFSGTDQGKHVFGKLALKIPVINNMTIKSASSMTARTLSTLLGSGVPLIEAVDIVSGVVTNVYFQEALQHAKDEITIGMPLSRPLEECGLFPPMVYHMIRIGEEAGNSEEMLDKLADYYDEEVEMAVQSLMAAMEPMIIVVLAIVVGGLVAACMAPMLSMYSALDNL